MAGLLTAPAQICSVGTVTSRVQCRGIELLGMSATPPFTYVCVHQLSVELWKRYDTPRAAVQKKMEALKCKAEFCTKEQIRVLREKGIVDNCRATNISLHQAELLFDALETSRRKRGLEKHKLKGAHRHLRKEEVKIRKMTLKRDIRRQKIARKIENAAGCALNRIAQRIGEDVTSATTAASTTLQHQAGASTRDLVAGPDLSIYEETEALLVAEDAVELPGFSDWECTVSIDEATASPNSQLMAESSSSSRMVTENEPPSAVDDQCSFIQSLSSASDGALDTLAACPVGSRLRSPSLVSSCDLDEQTSHRSLSTSSTRSHSSATTPTKSSPDRFLYMDSDDSDYQGPPTVTHRAPQPVQYRGIPHKGKDLREISDAGVQGSSGGEGGTRESLDDSGLNKCGTLLNADSKHRNVTATKLLHYAKTTSPSAVISSNEQPSRKPSPLIVSVSLSSLSTSPNSRTSSSIKPRKPTQLLNFATKKRAISRSPSVASSRDDLSPTTLSGLLPTTFKNGLPDKAKSGGALPKGGVMKGGRAPKKGGRGKSKLSVPTECSSSPKPVEAGCNMEGSAVGRVRGSEDQTLPTDDPRGLDLPPCAVAPEEDEMSVTSSNTTASSANSLSFVAAKTTKSQLQQPSSQRGGGKNSRGGVHGGSSSTGSSGSISNSNPLRINSNFSLESLFSFCPPTLTIRNGELVPEKSLSIKNVDQSSLPASHPIHTWSLGQPVRSRWMVGAGGTGGGTGGPRPRKPRKNTARPAKE